MSAKLLLSGRSVTIPVLAGTATIGVGAIALLLISQPLSYLVEMVRYDQGWDDCAGWLTQHLGPVFVCLLLLAGALNFLLLLALLFLNLILYFTGSSTDPERPSFGDAIPKIKSLLRPRRDILISGLALLFILGIPATGVIMERNDYAEPARTARSLIRLRSAFSQHYDEIASTIGTAVSHDQNPMSISGKVIVIDEDTSAAPGYDTDQDFLTANDGNIVLLRKQLKEQRTTAPRVSAFTFFFPTNLIAQTPNQAGSIIFIKWTASNPAEYRSSNSSVTYTGYEVNCSLSVFNRKRKVFWPSAGYFAGPEAPDSYLVDGTDHILDGNKLYFKAPISGVKNFLRSLPIQAPKL